MEARIDFSAPESTLGRFFRDPVRVLTAWRHADVLDVLTQADTAARNGLWAVGFVAYEAAPAFDPALTTHAPLSELPLTCFALFEQSEPTHDDANDVTFSCAPWRADIDPSRFAEDLAQIRAAIRSGRFYQSNHTTRVRSRYEGDATAFYQALRQAQPNGYGFYLNGGTWQILSVSPELFFDAPPGGPILTRPMKGTSPRHADPGADAAAAMALRNSEKEQAENLMIVDLLRNDLSRLAEPGGVDVPALLEIEALPSLWQMTSTVRCRPRPEVRLPDIFSSLFPSGSVTGAPKVAAMRAIVALETTPRGPYCGALGVIRPGGHATFSVGIRTVLVSDGAAQCGIGSGITWDATIAGEHAEWQAKRRFLWRASAGFELLETMRLEDGCFPLLHRHRQRMAASAAHFGFVWNEKEFTNTLATIAHTHPHGTWRVRLRLERTGHVLVEVLPLAPSPDEGVVAWANAPVDSRDELLRHKTTHRMVYERHAPPLDSAMFDTLLYNERDEVTEFTRGNLVAEIDGRRLTPAVACGLLAGTRRAELLACGDIAEAVVTRADVARATQLWFANGLRGVLPVRLAG